MVEYRSKAKNIEEEFDPSEQLGGIIDLKEQILSGSLVTKFISKEVRFPTLPIDFIDAKEYKSKWKYLLQYEIYSKLLSRTYNKKQKIVVEEDRFADDLNMASQEQVIEKKKKKKVWVSYLKYVPRDDEDKQNSKKQNNRRTLDSSNQFKMYIQPPSEKSL